MHHRFNTSCTVCMFIVQRSTHSSIRLYSAVIFWLGIIQIPIGLTLIIAVISLSQSDISHLGKQGFECNWASSSDWNHPTVVVYCCTSCAYCQHFLCSLLFVHIPILILHQQLIGLIVRHTPTDSQIQTRRKQSQLINHQLAQCKYTCTCTNTVAVAHKKKPKKVRGSIVKRQNEHCQQLLDILLAHKTVPIRYEEH